MKLVICAPVSPAFLGDHKIASLPSSNSMTCPSQWTHPSLCTSETKSKCSSPHPSSSSFNHWEEKWIKIQGIGVEEAMGVGIKVKAHVRVGRPRENLGIMLDPGVTEEPRTRMM